MTLLEKAKGRTLKEVSGMLGSCYSWAARGINIDKSSWYREHLVRKFCNGNQELEGEADALLDWAYNNPTELEVYMAGRSPTTAARWAVRHNKRLCAEAEKIVKEKAKDKSTLLDYCSHFSIVIDDLTKVTMKAAFEPGSLRETAYIKKIELTKKRTKEFLSQMVSIGQLDSSITVKELIETL